MSEKALIHERYDIDDRRGHVRRAVSFLEAKIIADGQAHECRILNISEGGAKLSAGRHIGSGTEILLEIGRFGQFGGTVVWQSGEALGIKFSDGAAMSEVIPALAMYG